MDLMKWEPFGELSTFRRQIDRLLESFFGRERMLFERERCVPSGDPNQSWIVGKETLVMEDVKLRFAHMWVPQMNSEDLERRGRARRLFLVVPFFITI